MSKKESVRLLHTMMPCEYSYTLKSRAHTHAVSPSFELPAHPLLAGDQDRMGCLHSMLRSVQSENTKDEGVRLGQDRALLRAF